MSSHPISHLDSYLARIGYTGPRTATLDTLTALATLQPQHIVYDNIEPLLGKAPTLDPERLQQKLVHNGHGGYCYEQNLLLREMLMGLGFEVTALAARVIWSRPLDAPLRPRTHMLLLVNIPGEEVARLVDVGFGGNMLDAPLMFIPGQEQRTAHSVMRVGRIEDDHTLETQLPTGWKPMYRFTLEAHQPADYETLNWFTATHPGSAFCHNLLMERLTPEVRLTLMNDRLLEREPHQAATTQRLTTLDAFAEVLRTRFGLHLPQETVSAVYERMPKGFDQFVVPSTPT